MITPTGWKLMPPEPTPEIIAAAAIAAWPTASLADIELARKAAPIVLMQMNLAAGTSADSIAAVMATMAPAYRAMWAAVPDVPAAAPQVVVDERETFDRMYLSMHGFHTKAELEKEWQRTGAMFCGALAAAPVQEQEPVGNFLYVGGEYVATGSDDPRGIKLYRAPAHPVAVPDSRKQTPNPFPEGSPNENWRRGYEGVRHFGAPDSQAAMHWKMGQAARKADDSVTSQPLAVPDDAKWVAKVHVTHNGYAMTLAKYKAYVLPEGTHELFAAPAAPSDAKKLTRDQIIELAKQSGFSVDTAGHIKVSALNGGCTAQVMRLAHAAIAAKAAS